MRRFAAVAVVGLLSACALGTSGARSEPPKSPECRRDGRSQPPFIHNEAVARAIYRAVVWPKMLQRYPVILVDDEGDHWHVSQTNNASDPIPKKGEMIVTAGGGQVDLDIDKCTGAISNFTMNK